MIQVTSPATIFDMAELSGAVSRPMWAVAREMWANGSTFAIRSGEDLIGLAGFYPIDGAPGAAEAWFNVAPAAAQNMLGICRAIKLTIRASGYREIVAVCTSEAGKRIAAAAGMTFFAQTDLGEVWSCRNCSEATTSQRSS